MWMRAALTCLATLALSGTALGASGQQISVNGTGGAAVPAGASNAEQQTAYDQALGAAIGDAQAKAQMVAKQLSLTLGSVQSFTEQSDDYLGYCGVGFLPGVATSGVGAPRTPAAVGAPSGQLTRIPARHRKHRTKRRAHKAQAGENTCELQADVTVVYSAG